jgi:hypothetical protein
LSKINRNSEREKESLPSFPSLFEVSVKDMSNLRLFRPEVNMAAEKNGETTPAILGRT